MDEALGQSLSPEEGEEAVAELEAMEADYARLEAAEQLPSAPLVALLLHQSHCLIALFCAQAAIK